MPVSKIPGAGISGGSVTVNQSAPDNSLVIDSGGNVGIGTTSPTQRLHVSTSSDTYIQASNTSGTPSNIFMGAAGSTNVIISRDGTTGDRPLLFFVGTAERMRIDSSGNLLVGTTSTNPIASRVNGFATGPVGFLTLRATNNMALGLSGNTGSHITFYTDNGSAFVTAGNISSNGSSTAYNTSSDYRMKTDVRPMVGGLNKVMQLKPVTYKWKDEFAGTNPDGEGFIAHELQEHCPNAVTGEKDAVDAEGKPVYQSIDTSFLVATLTAAIQEQQAIIEELKARIETLEAK